MSLLIFYFVMFTDLGQTLLELGLSNRQALIVVLHRRANTHRKGGSTVHDLNQEGSSIRGNEGYWGYMRRVLSYMNPFSYMAGSSNSLETAQESQSSMWQYGKFMQLLVASQKNNYI